MQYALFKLQEEEKPIQIDDDYFRQALFIPKSISKYVILEEDGKPLDPQLEKLIEVLQQKGILSTKILNIFKVIDRKFFLNHDLIRDDGDNLRSIMIAAAGGNLNPYADTPKPIGWNTTISAPSMHAETLKNLYEHLLTAKTILDIGTGSGFLTAAMAYVAPQGATVYAVDHIEGLNQFARSNIQKVAPQLIKKHKIVFVTQDGRKGLKEF